jgi:ABC-type dipeptide/oligopeptide/nickel transport system ATPase component
MMNATTGREPRQGLSAGHEATAPLLVIDRVSVVFPTRQGEVTVLDQVSLQMMAGEVFGVIGETGAGKSMTGAAAMGLVPPPGRLSGGRVLFDGRDMAGMDADELRDLRGNEIGLIVQNPKAALNPVAPVGKQIANAYRSHHQVGRRAADQVAVRSLASVGLPDPQALARAYPHQLSGGMAQRAMIAMALVNEPRLVIADEPTTGLDVTVQAAILDLMMRLVGEQRSSVMNITHDLGIIANYCDRAAVMLAGRVVEIAPVDGLFAEPLHPYTRGLVHAFQLDRPSALALRAGAGAPDDGPVCRTAPAAEGAPGLQDITETDVRRASPPGLAPGYPGLEEVHPGHWVRCRPTPDAQGVRLAEAGG